MGSVDTVRLRTILLSLVAVFAVSASASASALEYSRCKNVGLNNGFFENSNCKKEGGNKEWKFVPIEAGVKVKVEGAAGAGKLESTIAGLKWMIECQSASFTGELEEGGKSSNDVVRFSGCEFFTDSHGVKTAQPACAVVEPLETKKLKNILVAGPALGPEVEFAPETGKVFAEFEITNCALAAKVKFETATEGKGQTCELPEGSYGRVDHEIECSSDGSGELRIGANKVSFFANFDVKLESGAWWIA